jgi:hypothetical protein
MERAGLMSTTELDEVQALLERVLPDPSGYAQRLLLQAMTRWGQATEPPASAFYTATTPEDTRGGGIVMTPDQPDADEASVDTNLLLAGALGACECWGLQTGCELCRGRGGVGWIRPDPVLFEEFVKPAIARFSDISPGGHEQPGGGTADNSDNDETAQGENT